MRTTFATVVAVAAVASTAAAYEFEEDIFAREAEPILGLNHLGKWAGQAAGSVVGGFRGKSQPQESYEQQQYRRSLDELEEIIIAARDAEPILGLNHIGKWIGKAAGSVVGGFRSKANKGQAMAGGMGGEDPSQFQQRSYYDDEDLEFYAREADPKFGMNHLGKWAGQAAGAVVGGFRKKAGGRHGGGMPGGGMPTGGDPSQDPSAQQPQRRSLSDDELLEVLYARYAEADAEPILGLNHIGKWIGNAAGSVVGGFKSKSGGSQSSEESYGQQQYRREAEAEDELFWDEY